MQVKRERNEGEEREREKKKKVSVVLCFITSLSHYVSQPITQSHESSNGRNVGAEFSHEGHPNQRERGESSISRRQVSSQDIYTSQTPINYEKGDPRMSKQNVNAQADRANNEHSKCSRKKEHGKREKVERETAHEENTG